MAGWPGSQSARIRADFRARDRWRTFGNPRRAMTTVASITELQDGGLTVEADEAVAIAQQLIRSLRAAAVRHVEPPYGPPTAANVFLNEDGSVTCRGCDTAPAVFEIAIFLDALLSPSPRVPGGLRYAIARAMLAVDVAPFD